VILSDRRSARGSVRYCRMKSRRRVERNEKKKKKEKEKRKKKKKEAPRSSAAIITIIDDFSTRISPIARLVFRNDLEEIDPAVDRKNR